MVRCTGFLQLIEILKNNYTVIINENRSEAISK